MSAHFEYSWQMPGSADMDDVMDRAMKRMLGWEKSGITVPGSAEVTVDGHEFTAKFDIAEER